MALSNRDMMLARVLLGVRGLLVMLILYTSGQLTSGQLPEMPASELISPESAPFDTYTDPNPESGDVDPQEAPPSDFQSIISDLQSIIAESQSSNFGSQSGSSHSHASSYDTYGTSVSTSSHPHPHISSSSHHDRSSTFGHHDRSSTFGHHDRSSTFGHPHPHNYGGVSSHSQAFPSDSSQHQHPSPKLSSPILKDPQKDFRIVCLFNNKHYSRGGFTPAFIEPSLCTHVNYEFAILDPKTYEMIIGDPDLDIQKNFYQEAIDLKKSNPKLKVLLSLGGWDDSTGKYSEMAEDKSRRKNFIDKAIYFLKSHEFDGMDLAWEYPNCWQGAIGINPKDKVNFVTLLQEIKPQFEENNLLLSISVGAIKREVDIAYDIAALSGLVDFINVMTYDMHGPWESKTGHHTQFEAMPEDTDPFSNVKSAIKIWTDSGADKKKLNLGLASYAKTYTLQDQNNFVMGAPVLGIGDPGPESKEGGFLLFNEVCKFLNSGNWTEKEDEKSGFYAYSGDQWACYDPPEMMARKAKYVVEEGLGGVLMKDLGGDDYEGSCFSMTFPLLKMIKYEIIHKVKGKERA